MDTFLLVWSGIFCVVIIILLPRAHAQGVKQSSVVVVVGTKIARSRVLGVCACYKHSQSVGIDEKLVCTRFSKRLASATNRTFSVQHACGLSTTPTVLVCGCDCACSNTVLERVVTS